MERLQSCTSSLVNTKLKAFSICLSQRYRICHRRQQLQLKKFPHFAKVWDFKHRDRHTHTHTHTHTAAETHTLTHKQTHTHIHCCRDTNTHTPTNSHTHTLPTSPHYPQSTGPAKNTVQTAKRIQDKVKATNKDPYLGLLQYHNTPVDPKSLRSIFPVTAKQLTHSRKLYTRGERYANTASSYTVTDLPDLCLTCL